MDPHEPAHTTANEAHGSLDCMSNKRDTTTTNSDCSPQPTAHRLNGLPPDAFYIPNFITEHEQDYLWKKLEESPKPKVISPLHAFTISLIRPSDSRPYLDVTCTPFVISGKRKLVAGGKHPQCGPDPPRNKAHANIFPSHLSDG